MEKEREMDAHIIYKCRLEITDTQIVHLPTTHKLLHVGILNGELFLWAQVSVYEKRVERTMHVVYTGHNVINPDWEYVGIAVDSSHMFECHVYVEPLKGETI